MEKLNIDQDKGIAFGKYTGYVVTEEFIRMAKSHLKQIEQNKLSKFLLDLREFKVMSDESRQYIMEEWFHQAYEIGLRYFAILYPESVISGMAVKNTKQSEELIDLRFFSDDQEAVNWLDANSHAASDLPMQASGS